MIPLHSAPFRHNCAITSSPVTNSYHSVLPTNLAPDTKGVKHYSARK
jgi:hypothetical protein